jgi:hypothetical protein
MNEVKQTSCHVTLAFGEVQILHQPLEWGREGGRERTKVEEGGREKKGKHQW